MRLQRLFASGAMLFAALAASFAFVPAQAADGKEDIHGVITSRSGDNLVLRDAGGNVIKMSLTSSTTIYELQGPLGLGILPSSKPREILEPGLKVTIEPESAAQRSVAKNIRFNTGDMETLYAIQAALAVPQAQINALTQELAAQKQHNAIQDQAIADSKSADAAFSRRMKDLADYDQKAEISVQFDVNSATLSDKAKADLKQLAAQANALRGYLIQVVGYADAVGSAGRNQVLSDRRAAAVVAYLQQECDVALSRVLTPVAMGASNPVAPNETAQGRAENRRARVRIAVNRGIGE